MKALKIYFVALIIFATHYAAQAQTAANQVLTAYYGVKNALVSDNATEAQARAKVLLTALNNIPADQQNGWRTYIDKLQFDSCHISESTALDHQREHFASLSKNMFEAVKALKQNNTPVYEQYCPMKRTTWLSETTAIQNPYYGKQMLTCGKTKETLPAAQ